MPITMTAMRTIPTIRATFRLGGGAGGMMGHAGGTVLGIGLPHCGQNAVPTAIRVLQVGHATCWGCIEELAGGCCGSVGGWCWLLSRGWLTFTSYLVLVIV